MNILARAGQALAWLGRQGTRAVAASVFLGLAIPQLSEIFRPLVGPAIFCLLVFSFLRVEPATLRGEFRPARLPLLLAATIIMMIATPIALGSLYAVIGESKLWHELSLALVLQSAAPPITSAPAFIAFLGLDIALSLAALITTTIATPITAPFFAAFFGGDALPLDPWTLALRLTFFLGGTFVVAWAIRRWVGDERIRAWREPIDGLNVIALFIFAAAVMGIVTYRLFTDPLLVLELLALSFIVTFGLIAVTAAIFWPAGAERALTLGTSAGIRNMGLMLAATSGLSEVAWLYIAVAQFPIFLAPQLLHPLVSRIQRSRLPPGR
jgi:hypothetical protein